jgi:hypothetical protein
MDATTEALMRNAVGAPTVNAARIRLPSISHLTKMLTGTAAISAPTAFSNPNHAYTPTFREGQIAIHQDGVDVNGIRPITMDARQKNTATSPNSTSTYLSLNVSTVNLTSIHSLGANGSKSREATQLLSNRHKFPSKIP